LNYRAQQTGPSSAGRDRAGSRECLARSPLMRPNEAGILNFPTVSYEEAQETAARLIEAGFPTAAIAISSADEGHEVVLHTSPSNRARAKRAVYGSPFPKALAVASGAALLGAALWSIWPRAGRPSRDARSGSFSTERTGVTAQPTTLHMSAEQAAPDHPDGFLVLNGDADGPATTVQQDSARRDVRARSEADALKALSGRFAAVRLIEHYFPDVSEQGLHRVQVWAPDTHSVGS
jgi:hypothetical protein